MNEIDLRRQAQQRTEPPSQPPVRRQTSRWWLALWVLVIAAVIGGVAWWAHNRPAPAPRVARFTGGAAGAMPVVTAAAAKGDVHITLNALGTVTPLAVVTVKSQISGQIMRIDFTEGQEVKQGDPLAEIDSRPYALALEQAQGQMQRDQALLRNAQLDLARYQTLARQDSIAKQQVDTQAALLKQYEGTLKTDQAQIDSAKLNIAYCHIVAPISGRVGLRLVDQGNYIQANDTTGIVVITQMQPMGVIFSVPEDNLPSISTRLRSGATLPVTAYDRSQTRELATGTLTTFDNQIDQSTGTVRLKGIFANDKETLFPNQFVTVQMLVDTLHDAVTIPSAAVQRGAPGTFVYMVKPDNTVTVEKIKLGPAEADRIAVLSGLQPGDQVVVDGADKLREGAKISHRDASGARAPASGEPPKGGPPGAAAGAAAKPQRAGTDGSADGQPHRARKRE